LLHFRSRERKDHLDPAQLKQVPLFANLTPDHLQKVAAIATPRILKMGEHIFREGEIGTEMYIIGTGKVRISKMVPGVGEEALAILEPGSYFGEMALIDDTPRSADATAQQSCSLYVIQKADLEQLMVQHKDLAYELLWTFVRTLSARLRETNDKIKAFFAISARF
jgi:CRP/FNR family cyclic AMP-dependent transcriptional regulator